MTVSRKALRIGTSIGTTLPKEFLRECGIRAGSELAVSYDAKRRSIVITCSQKSSFVHRDQVAHAALQFIKKYKSDLKALKNK